MKSPTIIPFVIWLGVLLALVLLLHPRGVLGAEKPPPKATLILKAGPDWVRLHDEPCPVSSGWFAMKRAQWWYRGAYYEACWMLSARTVVIFDEAGQLFFALTTAFQKDEGI